MKRFKIFSKKTIIAGSVIFVSFLFVLMAFAPALSGAGQTATPATQTGTSYIPSPQLNTQVTWSSFNSSMSFNEYINATGGKQYLNAEPGQGNYIIINPQDIQSSYLQNDNISTLGKWDKTVWTSNIIGSGGQNQIIGISGTNVYMTANDTQDATASSMRYTIPISDLLSDYPNYNYITLIYSLSGKAVTGTTGGIDIGNGTTDANINTITPGSEGYFSLNMEQISKLTGLGMNITGTNAMTDLNIIPVISTPATTDDYTYNLSIQGMALTTYALSLGSNSTGGIINQGTGNIYLSNLTPVTPMTIINNGYSENITQPLNMTNETISQAKLNGNYIEQITSQGTLQLPTAPGISYTGSTITINLSGIPGKQFEVVNLNGVSYTSSINTMNGTETLSMGTVNPNSPNSVIVTVELTQSEWNKVSHAPSFFTLRGIEYYWWVGLIAALSAIGLGAAAMTHFGGDEEALKIPKGKFGR